MKIETSQTNTTAAVNETEKPDSDSVAFILQTSGTTSEPKLIPTRHRNMLAAAARVKTWFDLSPQDRCLSVSPVFYAHGLHVTVFASLLSGGTSAFPSDASKFDFIEWFGALKPTWYSSAPTLHRLVFDHAKSVADIGNKHSLRFILAGGAPLPSDLQDGLKKIFGVPVVEHYGSSEGMQICANQLPPGLSKSGTCGVPWPDTVAVVSDDGRRLPPGQQGEILVGGPTVVSEYLNAPELTLTCFVDGWFKSGDVGRIDADGFLTLLGRKNEIINRGGEKISPVEVDEALLRHPAVAEAASFPVPHPRLGEDVAAAVVLRSGMTTTPMELRKYLQEQLASFKIPRQIIVQDTLPKGKTGKVLRRKLSEAFDEKNDLETKVTAPQTNQNSAFNTLVIQLTELWERLLKTAPVSLDDNFLEKGGDSLLAMEMLLELESLTGLPIPTSILFDAPTIRELAQKLFELDLVPRPITKLNPKGSRMPIFLFHSDYNGGGLYTARLAKALGYNQPLFVVAPHDIGREPITLPIESIAADRLRLILAAQPKGPYRLSGYCMGGLIAFEVARLLIASGEEVQLVGMIDSPTVGARPSVKMLLSAMRFVRPLAPTLVDRVIRRAWYICFQLDRVLHASKPRSEKPFKWATDDRLSMVDAVVNYSPKPLVVPVIYFAAEYSSTAWRRISPDIETQKIAGNHAEAVRDPDNLTKISEHLQRRP